jgi:hypothetical protein
MIPFNYAAMLKIIILHECMWRSGFSFHVRSDININSRGVENGSRDRLIKINNGCNPAHKIPAAVIALSIMIH